MGRNCILFTYALRYQILAENINLSSLSCHRSLSNIWFSYLESLIEKTHQNEQIAEDALLHCSQNPRTTHILKVARKDVSQSKLSICHWLTLILLRRICVSFMNVILYSVRE